MDVTIMDYDTMKISRRNHEDVLLTGLAASLGEKKNSDIILCTGENCDLIPAHMAVLSCSSDYFKVSHQ